MNNKVDDLGQELAHRIRLEREARDWSLTQLAERAGVSKAAISKIERAESSPTAAMLVRLASAFDLTLAGLLVRAEADAARLSRKREQPTWQDPATGYQRTQLFVHPAHPVELVRVELPPGQEVSMPASSYLRIRQVVHVLAGVLTLTEGPLTHTLHAGDCLGFGVPADTRFANTGKRPCTYLVAVSRC